MPRPSHITVCGHFGEGKMLADGQTVKTQTLVAVLKDIYGVDMISICDTYRWQRKPLRMLLRCIRAARASSDVIMLPASKGVFIFIPLFSVLRKKYKTRLHYSLIGGWLAGRLEKSPYLVSHLRTFTTIQVETEQMKNELEKYQLKQIHVVPNFKMIEAITESECQKQSFQSPLPLCTFSRIMKEKGIEDAINVVTKLNSDSVKPLYTLDIYGAIDKNYKEEFTEIIKNAPSEVSYKGIVKSVDSVEILKKYYLLLFPTHYETEGLPGTIIDGYAAGLPVLSARWNSFSDVISEGKTGYGFELGNNQQFYDALKAAMNTDTILPLRVNCLKAFVPYSYSEAIKKLQSSMESE